MEKIEKVQYVGYIRVSTKEQAKEGFSLEFQSKKIKEYFNINNIDNYKILVDDGYSAITEDRPRYQELKKLVVTKKLKMIVVYKMDRLHRNVSNCNNFINSCLINNIALHSINEKLDYQTAMGRAFTNISASFSQLESELISERTKNGFIGKAQQGKYPYKGTIYGYDKVNNKLIINNKEASIINYIFKNHELKIHKLIELVQIEYGVNLTYNKIHSIYRNYPTYKTGNFNINNTDYLLADPIIVNKHVIKLYNEHLKLKIEKKIKNNHIYKQSEYKYYNKVYFKENLLKHSCGYGKSGRKYYYYIDKSVGFKVSEKYIDQILNNESLMKNIEIKEQFKVLFELYVDNRIDNEQLIYRLNSLKRKSSIKQIIFTSFIDYKIIYY